MGKISIYLDADGKDPEEEKEIIDRSWSPGWLKTRAQEGVGCREKVHVRGLCQVEVKLRLSVKASIFSVK